MSAAVDRTRPPAIVLGLGVTGLSVARSLAAEGVVVHGVWSGAGEPGRFSRACTVTAAVPAQEGEHAFVDWLASYAATLDRPVVLPTSDRYALWLARHRDRLSAACRMWSTAPDVIEAIISKDRFYALVESASLRAPPSIVEPDQKALRAWCERHPAPYLIKPFHESALANPLGAKNQVAADVTELMAQLDRPGGSAGLIVQQMLRGGDGWHYLVTGLRDATGRLRSLVTRRKLIQYPPDRGSAAHARLPACDSSEDETVFLDAARALLSTVRFHGLFSCEWVKDRASGEIFALDFNPRSISGNSHLVAAGVNLAYLAYRDLLGEDLADVPEHPDVRLLYWSDWWGCVGAWWRSRHNDSLPLGGLLRALRETDAWAVWSHRDPVPSVVHDAMQIGNLLRSAIAVRPAARD